MNKCVLIPINAINIKFLAKKRNSRSAQYYFRRKQGKVKKNQRTNDVFRIVNIGIETLHANKSERLRSFRFMNKTEDITVVSCAFLRPSRTKESELGCRINPATSLFLTDFLHVIPCTSRFLSVRELMWRREKRVKMT